MGNILLRKVLNINHFCKIVTLYFMKILYYKLRDTNGNSVTEI